MRMSGYTPIRRTYPFAGFASSETTEGSVGDEAQLREAMFSSEEGRARRLLIREALEDHARHDGLFFALGDELLRFAEAEAARRPPRPLACHDRPWLCVLLQTRRHVHGVTGDEEVGPGRLACRDDLAGVHDSRDQT